MITYLPKSLTKNSTIGLICPAGGLDSFLPVELTVKYLRKLGYKVKIGKSLSSKKNGYKYLSGSDKERLSDLHHFWSDNAVDAVFCLRGGYGCLRLLDSIDFNLIKKHKKILLGYSDITALLLSFYKESNLATFHGPLLGNKFLNHQLKPLEHSSEKNLWKLLNESKFKFSYSNKSDGVSIFPGRAQGKLLGGNLTVICSMIGSKYLPSFKNSILFLEDCHEESYKIDRLLTQLALAGIFHEVNGLIFSSFYKCKFKNNKEIVNLLKDKVLKYKIPTIFNFPIGHSLKNYTVPIGKTVTLDSRTCSLTSF